MSPSSAKGCVPQIFSIFHGEVASLQAYGAFVKIPGCKRQGLVHKSQMSSAHIEDPSEILAKGEMVYCKVIAFQAEGEKISLSMKVVNQTTGKDLDPNNVQLDQDAKKRRQWKHIGSEKIELGAELNTTCRRCGGHGHLTLDCFAGKDGTQYELIPDLETLTALPPLSHLENSTPKKKKKKKKKKKRSSSPCASRSSENEEEDDDENVIKVKRSCSNTDARHNLLRRGEDSRGRRRRTSARQHGSSSSSSSSPEYARAHQRGRRNDAACGQHARDELQAKDRGRQSYSSHDSRPGSQRSDRRESHSHQGHSSQPKRDGDCQGMSRKRHRSSSGDEDRVKARHKGHRSSSGDEDRVKAWHKGHRSSSGDEDRVKARHKGHRTSSGDKDRVKARHKGHRSSSGDEDRVKARHKGHRTSSGDEDRVKARHKGHRSSSGDEDRVKARHKGHRSSSGEEDRVEVRHKGHSSQQSYHGRSRKSREH